MTEVKWSFWKVGGYIDDGNGIELPASAEAHLRFMPYM